MKRFIVSLIPFLPIVLLLFHNTSWDLHFYIKVYLFFFFIMYILFLPSVFAWLRQNPDWELFKSNLGLVIFLVLFSYLTTQGSHEFDFTIVSALFALGYIILLSLAIFLKKNVKNIPRDKSTKAHG